MPKNMQTLPFFLFPFGSESKNGVLEGTQDLTSSTLNAWDGRHWCHRNCEQIHENSDILGVAKSICKAKCNSIYGAQEKSDDQPIQHTVTRVQRLEEDTTTLSEIQSELENIGDSFYSLEDSFSVL